MKTLWFTYALLLVGATFYIVGCVSPRPEIKAPVYQQHYPDYLGAI